MKLSLPPVGHLLARLAPRERLLVYGAVATVVVVILWLFVDQLRSVETGLRQRITTRERQLAEMQTLRKTYLALKSRTEKLTADAAKRPADFSLFSFLEGVGTRTVTREKIRRMSPSSKLIEEKGGSAEGFVEESVEMEIAGVGLAPVVSLLHEIEAAPVPLRVSRLEMKKRFNDPYSFDVKVVVAGVTRA